MQYLLVLVVPLQRLLLQERFQVPHRLRWMTHQTAPMVWGMRLPHEEVGLDPLGRSTQKRASPRLAFFSARVESETVTRPCLLRHRPWTR